MYLSAQSIRKMREPSIACLLLCIVAVSASAQDTDLCRSKGGLLSNDRPSVYITYETANRSRPTNSRLATSGNDVVKVEGEQNELSQEQRSIIWLRLHNNTRWAINFPTESLYLGESITPMRLCDGRPALGLRSGIKVSARYEVDQVIGSLDRADVFSRSWLPAGGSVLFSVPREHIIERLGIYLPFNYEWEYGEQTFKTDEPQHRVYFRASDLPKRLKLQSSTLPK